MVQFFQKSNLTDRSTGDSFLSRIQTDLLQGNDFAYKSWNRMQNTPVLVSLA